MSKRSHERYIRNLKEKVRLEIDLARRANDIIRLVFIARKAGLSEDKIQTFVLNYNEFNSVETAIHNVFNQLCGELIKYPDMIHEHHKILIDWSKEKI